MNLALKMVVIQLKMDQEVRFMKTTHKPLSNTYPVIAQEAYGWNPSEVLANSHEKIAWKCSKNHIWVEKIINRTENNVNCPKCEKIN